MLSSATVDSMAGRFIASTSTLIRMPWTIEPGPRAGHIPASENPNPTATVYLQLCQQQCLGQSDQTHQAEVSCLVSRKLGTNERQPAKHCLLYIVCFVLLQMRLMSRNPLAAPTAAAPCTRGARSSGWRRPSGITATDSCRAQVVGGNFRVIGMRTALAVNIEESQATRSHDQCTQSQCSTPHSDQSSSAMTDATKTACMSQLMTTVNIMSPAQRTPLLPFACLSLHTTTQSYMAWMQ